MWRFMRASCSWRPTYLFFHSDHDVKALIALLICTSLGTAVASADLQSRSALMEFFTSKEQSRSVETTEGAVEICSDWCQRYASDRGLTTAQVWDVIFLHQYYYVGRGPREEFRARYATLAASLMSRYAKLCPRAEETARPGCVIGYLGSRNNLRFATIYEANGQRCEVWGHLVHSKTIYKSSCGKLGHGPLAESLAVS